MNNDEYATTGRERVQRYKSLRVSAQFIIRVCKSGCSRVEIAQNALPDDAKLIGIRLPDYLQMDELELIVESEAFPATLPDAPLEPIAPTLFRHLNLSAEEINLIHTHRRLKASLDAKLDLEL